MQLCFCVRAFVRVDMHASGPKRLMCACVNEAKLYMLNIWFELLYYIMCLIFGISATSCMACTGQVCDLKLSTDVKTFCASIIFVRYFENYLFI